MQAGGADHHGAQHERGPRRQRGGRDDHRNEQQEGKGIVEAAGEEKERAQLGEVIGDEIKRLTGAMDDFDPKRARDSLLAEYAINTAKARSGDTGALDTLTKLSKEIENAT